MRFAVVGSRDYLFLGRVREVVGQLIMSGKATQIISGGAKGVDKVAAETATDFDKRPYVIPANWDLYGKSAGFVRNKLIVRGSDATIAFWDGKSKGTRHTIDLTLAAGKKLYLFGPDGQEWYVVTLGRQFVTMFATDWETQAWFDENEDGEKGFTYDEPSLFCEPVA